MFTPRTQQKRRARSTLPRVMGELPVPYRCVEGQELSAVGPLISLLEQQARQLLHPDTYRSEQVVSHLHLLPKAVQMEEVSRSSQVHPIHSLQEDPRATFVSRRPQHQERQPTRGVFVSVQGALEAQREA